MLMFCKYNQVLTVELNGPDPPNLRCLPVSATFTPPPFPKHHSIPSVDIFPTQLLSLEADSSLMMYHTRRMYPLVIERRAEQALMIDEQIGF